MSMEIHSHATRAYTAQYADPITGKTGDLLELGKHDAEWGFVWAVHTATGKTGWVPPLFLAPAHAPIARLLCDYDARELTISEGEPLILRQFMLGWFVAENARGVRGWVPKEHVEYSTDDYAALLADAQQWQ